MARNVLSVGAFLCICSIPAALAGGITLTNGLYSTVVVEFTNQTRPPASCGQYFNDFEQILAQASKWLHQESNEALLFGSFRIIVPSWWNTSQCADRIFSKTPPERADVLVGQTHPVHGDDPWTQQSLGCKKPGDFIALSTWFISNRSVSSEEKGRALFRQWARYRYGILDDSSCRRIQNSELCAPGPGVQQTIQGKFPLYFAFCNSEPAFPRHIFLAHRDMSVPGSSSWRAPHFAYQKLISPKLVVAADSAVPTSVWEDIRRTFRRMAAVSEPDAELAFLKYGNQESTVYRHISQPIKNVTNKTNALYEFFDHDNSARRSCLKCALKRSAEILVAGGSETRYPHPVLFLVATNATDDAQVKEAISVARQVQMHVYVLGLGLTNTTAIFNLAALADKTDGAFYHVPECSSIEDSIESMLTATRLVSQSHAKKPTVGLIIGDRYPTQYWLSYPFRVSVRYNDLPVLRAKVALKVHQLVLSPQEKRGLVPEAVLGDNQMPTVFGDIAANDGVYSIDLQYSGKPGLVFVTVTDNQQARAVPWSFSGSAGSLDAAETFDRLPKVGPFNVTLVKAVEANF